MITLFLPCWPWQKRPPLTSSVISFQLVFVVQGLCQGMLDPLFYLCAVELCPGVSPGISSNLLMLVFNVATFVLLAITPAIGSSLISPIIVGVLFMSSVSLVMVLKEKKYYSPRQTDGDNFSLYN